MIGKGVPAARPLSFADGVALQDPVYIGRHKRVPCLSTKMRNIDHGGRVISRDDQNVSGRQCLQPFAGLEHGQGAEQPYGVEFICIVHKSGNRRDVTHCPQTCDRMKRDVWVKGV